MSIRLLSVVLDSLADKNPEHNIEWYVILFMLERPHLKLYTNFFFQWPYG